MTFYRPQIDGVAVELDVAVTFDPLKYHVRGRDGCFDSMSEESIKLRLRSMGLSTKVSKKADLSPVEVCLLAYQTNNKADAFGSLSGHRPGLFEMGGRRFLVTDDARPTKPSPGEWPTLNALLTQLFGEEQLPFFIGWLRQARRSVSGTTMLPGHVVVLCGRHGIGKSFLQSQVITPMIGGRQTCPFDYMAGVSNFNGELFGADHLAVEDKFFKWDMDTRRKFGTHLKELAVNHVQRCHFKGKTPVSVTPKWRITISLNPERENLNVLPPLDDSIKEKLMMFYLNEPTCLPTDEDRERWGAAIHAELPAFAYAVDSFTLPTGLEHSRYGVKEYHSPRILEQLEGGSTEELFLDCLLHDLPGIVPTGATTWEGTSTDLERVMLAPLMPSRETSRKILSWPGAAGTQLGRLSRQHADSIVRKKVKGVTRWTIKLSRPDE